MNCSVARTLEIVGEWWTMLIIREAFFGIRRFDDMQRRLGIARNVLAARLQMLVENGILERRLYQEQRIPVYWIVDIERRQVEVWTPEAHFPVIEREQLVWRHPALEAAADGGGAKTIAEAVGALLAEAA